MGFSYEYPAFFGQPHKYWSLMSKSETKKEPRDMSVWKCPHSQLVPLSRVDHSTYRSILHVHIMNCRDETDMSTHFQSAEMFKSNGRMQRSVHGCVWVGLSLRLSHTDGSNQMFLSFKKCPGGYVCKGLLASEYSINASQLLYNSVYLSVTVLNSIYQGVGLSCTFECIFLILAKKKGLPQRYLNSFQKMHKKKPSDRFI